MRTRQQEQRLREGAKALQAPSANGGSSVLHDPGRPIRQSPTAAKMRHNGRLSGKAVKRRRIECVRQQAQAQRLASFQAQKPLTDEDRLRFGRHLFRASRNGKVEDVRTVLNEPRIRGPPCDQMTIDFPNHEGATSLFVACHCGHDEVVRVLLEAKAAVDKPMNDDSTPTYISAEYGHIKCLEILIEFKADINLPERDGATPLHIAAHANNPQVVQTLVQAKAVVDQEARGGNSPLYTAAQAGNLEVVEALLNSGAQIDKARQDGSTPLHMSSQRGHEGVVTTLLERKASVNHLAEPSKATALHVAAGQGHHDLVKLLLSHGADSALRLAQT